jgi:RNA polymerase sigma factor (sigma-70 family)
MVLRMAPRTDRAPYAECAGQQHSLLQRAQAGDHRAMNDLMLDILPFVRRVCRPIAHGHGPDAAQEAMIAIYRGLHGLRDPAAFYGWVRAVAVREAVRTARRAGKAPSGVLPEVEQGWDPLAAVDITDALDRLPERHRQVLTLRAMYGLSEQEAARVLAVPVGTVRSRLSRARRHFRDAW